MSSTSSVKLGTITSATAVVATVTIMGRLWHKLQKEREARAAAETRKRELALELMAIRNHNMQSAESMARGKAPSWTARPTDIVVVTYPKCGTTWMTQICHVLRTGGAPALNDFSEITCVVPWDILAYDCKQDLNADHVASPRVFKSHESVGTVATGGKYIYVARNPDDAFVSFYKFLPAYMELEPDDITMEDFCKAIFAGVSTSGGIWDHFLGWWRRRKDPNVLWVFYEDLQEDLPGQVRRVAEFMGLSKQLDQALIDKVCAMSSLSYMAEHVRQFDDHFVTDARRDILCRGKQIRIAKVRKDGGRVGGRASIPKAVRESLAARWRSTVEAETGFATYEDFRRSFDTRAAAF